MRYDMPSKTRPKPAFASLAEAAEAQKRIGTLLRQIHACEDQFEKEREVIDKKEDDAIRPLQAEALELGKQVYAFAVQHKTELTDGGTHKTVKLPMRAGSFAWYTTPPAITIENAQEVLQRIKELGLLRFVRTKEEVNREALLQEHTIASTIAGVTVSRQDKFAIKPTGVKVRLECNTKTKRWKIALP